MKTSHQVILSRSTTHEATGIQSLLYYQSSPALLVPNQRYNIMLHCFVTLFSQVSEIHSFAPYVFNNDLGFYKQPVFSHKDSSFKKFLDCASNQLPDFSDISWFPKILSLKSFGDSWGNSCTKFFVLERTSRFTCDE